MVIIMKQILLIRDLMVMTFSHLNEISLLFVAIEVPAQLPEVLIIIFRLKKALIVPSVSFSGHHGHLDILSID